MAQSAHELRNAVLAHVRRNHPGICRHWFEDIQAVDLQGGILRLLVGEPVQMQYLQRSCLGPFNDALQDVTQQLLTVRFVSEEDVRSGQRSAHANGRTNARAGRNDHPDADTKHASAPRAATGNVRSGNVRSGGDRTGGDRAKPGEIEYGYDEMLLSPDYQFDNFVVGPGNRLAREAAVAVSQRPGEAYNPYFIHGGVGLGKTHLIQSICQTLMRDRANINIYYVSCDTFLNKFMRAVQDGEMAAFRHRFRNVDVLMIDDIHFLSGHDRSQEEFFHTFNTLHQMRKQIVLSSDAAPNEIPDLEERLVSRFNSGLVARLEKPDYETRIAIVRKKAQMRGQALPDEVAAYIASMIDSNIRELEGAITTLQHRASVETEGEISLDLAKALLGDRMAAGNAQVTVQSIIEVVGRYYGVKPVDILSRKKTKSVAVPRQVGMWFARKLTRYGLKEIGGYFGGRDHSTVLHAIRSVDDRRRVDRQLAHDLDAVESQFQE